MNTDFFLLMGKPTWRDRIRNIFPFIFMLIWISLLVSCTLAYLDGEYDVAIYGAIVLMGSIPFLGMSFAMRD